IEEKFRAMGLTGRDLARALAITRGTGKGPPGANLDLKRMGVLQSVESARMPLANVTTPLAMVGMERQLVSTAQLFGTPGQELPHGGGLYPPSMRGAVSGSVRATERAEGGEFKPGTAIHEASEEQMRRHFELLAAVTQEMVFNDEEHMKRKVEELLRA